MSILREISKTQNFLGSGSSRGQAPSRSHLRPHQKVLQENLCNLYSAAKALTRVFGEKRLTVLSILSPAGTVQA